MKGRILDYNINKSSGIISGEDGGRYMFSNEEWKGDKSPAVNQMVDFAIDGDKAVAIYLDKNSGNGGNARIVAALLAFFGGALGIHKFYLGCNTAGVIMLVLFFAGFALGGVPIFALQVIASIEFIIYLMKSNDEFQQIYIDNERCWF